MLFFFFFFSSSSLRVLNKRLVLTGILRTLCVCELRDREFPQRGPNFQPVLPVRQPLPTCSGGHLACQPSWGLKAPSLASGD